MLISDYVWPQVTTSDYKWLRVTSSQTTSDYEWLQVTVDRYHIFTVGITCSLGITPIDWSYYRAIDLSALHELFYLP